MVSSVTSGRAASCTDDNAHFFRHVFETIPHAFLTAPFRQPTRATDPRRIERATVVDRRRRLLGKTATTTATSARAHERLHAMQQRRLSRHPTQLFEFAVAGARPTAARNNHNTHVSRRHFDFSAARPTVRDNTSEIVRTPITSMSSGMRRGTARSERNACVIPSFAASAKRRSA